MFLIQTGTIKADEINTKIAELEQEHKRNLPRLPPATFEGMNLELGADLYRAQFAIKSLSELPYETEEEKRTYKRKFSLW